MLLLTQGNLLEAPVDALVNTVNTVGVMGKGLALQFRERFKLNYKLYQEACKRGEVRIGQMFVTETTDAFGPRYIINFPTKQHWREPSRLSYIADGLVDLVRVVRECRITSLALPPLGCGNGGLDWEQVRPLIEKMLAEISEQGPVLLYAPSAGQPARVPEQDARLTPARAMLLLAMRAYTVLGESLTLLEVQKLAHFLHRLGETSLRPDTVKGHFGPYANNLNYLLQALDGTYLRGMKYRQAGHNDELELIPERAAELDAWAATHLTPAQQKRLTRLIRLIEGFESPLGMELLATVDHLFAIGEVKSPEALPAAVAAWSGSKAQRLTPDLLHLAYEWLRDAGMLHENAALTEALT